MLNAPYQHRYTPCRAAAGGRRRPRCLVGGVVGSCLWRKEGGLSLKPIGFEIPACRRSIVTIALAGNSAARAIWEWATSPMTQYQILFKQNNEMVGVG